MQKGLEKAVEGYNKAVGTMETRVLVSARKFQELGTGTSSEISELQPVDLVPRSLEMMEEVSQEAES